MGIFDQVLGGIGKVAGTAIPIARSLGYLKHGGKVQRTGLHHVHKGEVVVPAHVVKAIQKYSKKKPTRRAGR